MEEFTQTPQPADQLEALGDEDLKALITRAKAILNEREDERRKAALLEMRKLAKEHGLTFSAKKKPAKRRGRPKKTQDP